MWYLLQKATVAGKAHFVSTNLPTHQWYQESEMLLTSKSVAFGPSGATPGPLGDFRAKSHRGQSIWPPAHAGQCKPITSASPGKKVPQQLCVRV